MKPDIGRYLLQSAQTLGVELAERVDADYDKSVLGVFALLNVISAVEYDRAAEIRVWENGQMRALFADAALMTGSSTLRDSLVELAASEDSSVRISDLDAAGDMLQQKLIELQIHLEEQEDDVSQQLHRRLWQFLQEATDRRALHLSPFD